MLMYSSIGEGGGAYTTQMSSELDTGTGSVIYRLKRVPSVILCIRHFFPDGGGAEVSARRMSMRLVQRGIPLTVLTGRYRGRLRVEKLDGVLVRRHFIGLYVPVLHELCYLASLAWELVARRHEYDIVHMFQTHLSAFVVVALAKRLGKRVITRISCAGEFGDMAVWSSIPGGGRLLRHVHANVDAAIAVSKETMAELKQKGLDPKIIWYIPNGVAIPPSVVRDRTVIRARLGLSPRALITVFIGRLTAQKVPELLLDAWVVIRRKYPDAQLVLLGEGEQRAMLQAKVRRENLAQAVVFAGQVDNVNDYLEASDVFVLPSASEGLSNALLEAMAAGLPVVASRVSGTVDAVQDGKNGLLFERGDMKGLVDCLTSLIESPNQRAELGSQARKTVKQHFSLDRAADRYVALYRSLLSGSCCSE